MLKIYFLQINFSELLKNLQSHKIYPHKNNKKQTHNAFIGDIKVKT